MMKKELTKKQRECCSGGICGRSSHRHRKKTKITSTPVYDDYEGVPQEEEDEGVPQEE